MPRGANNRKLTRRQVQEIRDYLAVGGPGSHVQLAEMYNVSPSLIWNIDHGRAWAHLPVRPPEEEPENEDVTT